MENWKIWPIRQQPEYADKQALAEVVKKLQVLPPLVDPLDVEELHQLLAKVARNELFLLQAGDCVERFDESTPEGVAKKAQVLLDMASGIGREVVIVGRIGGQYAKPRSKATEKIGEEEVPIFRGELINGLAKEDRKNDPERLLQGYIHSSLTLGYLKDYPKIFCSHEGLVLDYEAALTRLVNGKTYNLSTHMPWIGHRTRHLREAHIQYFHTVCNPLGIKVGPPFIVDELADTIEFLNPDNREGKITLITRLGARNVRRFLPSLIETLTERNLSVIWSCDPMHGNDTRTEKGRKIRQFEPILEELNETIQVLREYDLNLGGAAL